MMKRVLRYTLMLVLISSLATGCASSKKRNGKLKPGKAIPCPTKDC